MANILSSEEMQVIEKTAIESGEVRAIDLMERAGEAVVARISQSVQSQDHVVHVYCGPGNNGGDGYVIARLLAQASWKVHVFALLLPEDAPAEAKGNKNRWQKTGKIHPLTLENIKKYPKPTIIIDAIFGTGLARPIEKPALIEIFEWAQISSARIIAVDIASGLSADTGWALGKALPASITITFHRPKLGHFLNEGSLYSGGLFVAPIGLEKSPIAKASEAELRPAQLLPAEKSIFDELKKTGGHKYEYGHALIISGQMGKTGAARLAAKSALRIGAGLVTIGAPKDAMPEIAAQITSLMLEEIRDTKSLESALKDERINALCLGPGLGLDRAPALVATALKSKRPIVLDADALSAFKSNPEKLFLETHPAAILTPHFGEFARIFPDLGEELKQGGIETEIIKSAAKRANAIILFKGETTIIADPEGECFIHQARYNRAAPWLATAGAGDVLAGLITGLLARGFTPLRAATLAAEFHVDCALYLGAGMIAEDIPDAIPKILNTAFSKNNIK